MMKLLYDANCVCVVVAHCGWSPAAVQPGAGDGGNPEIPVCHAHLQLHPGSNVCNTHIYTQLMKRTCVLKETVHVVQHLFGKKDNINPVTR